MRASADGSAPDSKKPVPGGCPAVSRVPQRFSGLLDVRYQVTDVAKSARIHGGSAGSDPEAALKSLPTFIREADGRKILPASAMMHFEHQHYQTEKLGTAFSMIYGNAGGLLHTGDKVTIRMADGLELQHVVVSS
jgi:hypothetical protein